jgi:hypothetical protein
LQRSSPDVRITLTIARRQYDGQAIRRAGGSNAGRYILVISACRRREGNTREDLARFDDNRAPGVIGCCNADSRWAARLAGDFDFGVTSHRPGTRKNIAVKQKK